MIDDVCIHLVQHVVDILEYCLLSDKVWFNKHRPSFKNCFKGRRVFILKIGGRGDHRYSGILVKISYVMILTRT